MTRKPREDDPGSMLSHAAHKPNLVSLTGLVCALLGIYFTILRIYPAAMIGFVWAVAFDWLDGRIARSIPGRTDEQRAFGVQLDSLIDVVSFGVAPALLLLSVGGFNPWFLPGAAVFLSGAVIRLSYFNVYGLADAHSYRGLALDNDMLVIVTLFMFRPAIAPALFAVILYVLLLVLGALNLAPIRTPKFGGNWYFALLAYALGATALYGWFLVG